MADSAPAGLDGAERRARAAKAEAYAIEETIRLSERKVTRLEERRLDAAAAAGRLRDEMARLDRRIDAGRVEFVREARRLYRERGRALPALLFSARSPREFARLARYARAAARAGRAKILAYVSARAGRSDAGRALDAASARLARAAAKLARARSRLGEARANKLNLLNRIDGERRARLSELRAWRAAHPGARPSFLDAKGRLAAPTAGRARAEFGDPVAPRDGSGLRYRGRYYAVGPGHEVRAVFGGTVAFASALPGLGRTVILDHGENYYTVYAHATGVAVGEGASVEEGAPIARTGPGAPRLGPGLYFEVRHFSDAVDPREWINDALPRSPDDANPAK